MEKRAKRFKNFLFNNYKGKKILIVSHGVFLQMFHGTIKGISCIESLGIYPANLELASFRFLGKKLVALESAKINQVSSERF